MSELVTGEAVVLGLRPAKLASRAVAVAIDLAVWWGTYLIVAILLASATASLDGAAVAAVTAATLLLLLVGLPIAVETLSRGRSLGKLVCGLRVLRDDGGPIRFRHALVRGAVGAVEIQLSMGVIACIASLVSARGRRLGDVFAGTLVVRERVPATYMRQPPPPPWLAGRLAGVDLSGLPDELWLAVRQYLARMGQLDQQVSLAMAERLAGDVAARTGRGVPQGVPPAAYLAAVVAERQARDARRVFGTGAGGPAGGAGARGDSGDPGFSNVPSGSAVPGGAGAIGGTVGTGGSGGGSAVPGPGSATGTPGEAALAGNGAAPSGFVAPAGQPPGQPTGATEASHSGTAFGPDAGPASGAGTDGGAGSGGGGTGFAPPA